MSVNTVCYNIMYAKYSYFANSQGSFHEPQILGKASSTPSDGLPHTDPRESWMQAK
jgi:hypothetical protein